MKSRLALTMTSLAMLIAGSTLAQTAKPVPKPATGPATDKALLEVSAVARVGDATFLAGDEEDYPVWMIQGSTLKSFTLKGSVYGDIEALAPLSDTDVLIVCSQALGEDGGYKAKRTRLGLLSFPKGLDGDATITAYDGFRDDVISYLSENQKQFADFTALTTKAPREGGFSIEGAAYDQKNNVLYLGTRDGRSTDGGAVIFPVTNIKAVMAQTEKPKFGAMTRIQISSFGVRDMTFAEDRVFILFGAMRGMQKPGASIASWNPASPGTVEMYDIPELGKLMSAEALYIDQAKTAHVFEDLDDSKAPQDIASIEHTFKLAGLTTKTLPVPGTPAPPPTKAASPAAPTK
ncbi:MAG TPA: hypothetical protein PKH51_02925 [Candidatus Sumerlaeota bacterium]|nr:hypothetical protein [Candidatus Sumerlaeota bacterium]